MSDSSVNRRPAVRIPSDEQMDRLLSRFFQQEVPARLADGLSPIARAMADHPQVSLTMPSRVSDSSSTSPTSRSSRIRQTAVAATLAALTACLLVVARVELPVRSTDSQTAAGRLSPRPSDSPAAADDLMLVSPNANRPSGTGATVGNDGVTLEETDGVDLQPKPADH